MQSAVAQQAHEHLVQFYESERYLVERVTSFVRAGLDDGAPALLIATGPHREALLVRLSQLGLDPARLIAERRLAVLDAQQTLDQFMVNGLPDWERFLDVAG